MSEPAEPLDAEHVRELLQELSDRLEARDEHAQLFVVGGAAMALAYDKRRLTRDVDALFAPAPAVRQIAEEISATRGLEPDWLNDAVKGFLPGNDVRPRTVFESRSLLVQVPSPEYLLAMKLHASRDERDLDDAAILFNELGYTTAQECIDLLTNTYPASQLLPRHRYIAEDITERAAARRNSPSQAPLPDTMEPQPPRTPPSGQEPASAHHRPPTSDPHSGPAAPTHGIRAPGPPGPTL